MAYDKALTAFMQNHAEVSEKMELLNEFVSNHMNFSPDEINFSHVGEAGRLNNLLDEIAEIFLSKEEVA